MKLLECVAPLDVVCFVHANPIDRATHQEGVTHVPADHNNGMSDVLLGNHKMTRAANNTLFIGPRAMPIDESRAYNGFPADGMCVSNLKAAPGLFDPFDVFFLFARGVCVRARPLTHSPES